MPGIAATLFSACSTSPDYSDSALGAEAAVVRPVGTRLANDPYSASIPALSLHEVDVRNVDGKRVPAGFASEIKLAPGDHTLEVSCRSRRADSENASAAVTVQISVEAKHVYNLYAKPRAWQCRVALEDVTGAPDVR
ncbi:MAG: hypothetical protein ACREUA_05910 [Burkholderiales bacterium]